MFERSPHRLVADHVHIPDFDHPVVEQVRFQVSGVQVAESGLQAMFDEALPATEDSVAAALKLVRNDDVVQSGAVLANLEQNAGVGERSSGSGTRLEEGAQGDPLLVVEGHAARHAA